MRTFIIKPGDLIPIGRAGENQATQIRFDVTGLADTFGAGTYTLVVKRPHEDTAYPVEVTTDGDYVVWTVSNVDAGIAGNASVQLRYVVDGALAKSVIYRGIVGESLDNIVDPPDPFEDLIQRMVDLAERTEAAAESAAGSAASASESAGTATAAKESAQAAAQTAQTAQGTATQAAQTATQAKDAAQAAQQAAEAAQSAAAQAATAASGSATAAAGSASQAAASATAADASADAAATSAATFETDPTLSIAGKAADAKAVGDSAAIKHIINRFNPDTISEGKYININSGNLASGAGFFASDFIYIGDLTSVTVSYTHLFGWYDANKNWLGHPDSMNSGTGKSDLKFEVPENAVYLRFSAYNASLELAQIGEKVIRSNYVPYGKYTLPDYVPTDNAIIVDINGNGDYTSLTAALYDSVNSGRTIRVMPGTYDIHAEYIAKWGASAVDAMADSDSATFNGFQFGAIIRNRKVIFEPGSHVVCDFTYQSDGTTPQTINGTHRMCALRMDYNAEVYGLNLIATHTFYAIHDDYGVSAPYTNIYENCYVKGVNLTNAGCLGGGCKPYSKHIIKNSYFDNTGMSGATARYHNTNDANAEPQVYVSNSYFTNELSFRWYGTQTKKMRAYVNNCHAKNINKMQESSSFNVDNVELYKWCNEETNPLS